MNRPSIRIFKVILLSLIIFNAFLLEPLRFEANALSENMRNNTLNIQIIFLGFEQGVIDQEYLDWNNLPYKYQAILIPGISNDVIFNFNYTYVVGGEDVTNQLTDYLNSIAQTETRYNLLWNYSYKLLHSDYATNYTSFEINTKNTFYEADKVSRWLSDRLDVFGGPPKNGYTLFVMNLYDRIPCFTSDQFDRIMQKGEVVATPHYYNKTYIDTDLRLRTNRLWMTSWGGHDRVYFIDVSAGPSMVDQQLPIQLALSTNNIPKGTLYELKWINQYLSDYINGAVENLFSPDFIYPITLAEKYVIDILVLDNRTENISPAIEETVNKEEIQKQIQSILPYAEVEVKAEYARLDRYSEIKDIVYDSTITGRGEKSFPPSTLYPPNLVDLRLLYEWLSESGGDHLKDYFTVIRNNQEWSIPVIVFAFQKDFNLGVTYKEWLAQKGLKMDIWGIALYDLVLISHSEYDLQMGDYLISGPRQPAAGYGFTQTIIHEVGHMIGLNHPFIYDPTQNYVDSVMSYYPYPTSFSQFDKDVLWRGLADELIKEVQGAITRSSSNPLLAGAIVRATQKLSKAEEKYKSMEYLDAVKIAKEALSELGPLGLISLPVPLVYVALFGVLFIGVIGFILGNAYAKRYYGKRQSIR